MVKKPGKTLLCLASYFKGGPFLEEAKRQGCYVILLTNEAILDKEWPRDSIDEVHAMPDLYETGHVIKGVSYLALNRHFDAIVALDDFDVETAARLREHLRIPGMGDTTARYFRDKLAMRVRARDCGIPVPRFIHVLNHDMLKKFMTVVPPPWVMKPRSQASAIGIRKIHTSDDLWKILDELGDQQSYNVLEEYIPGDVYHIDSIVHNKRVLFSSLQKYALPPMNVAHEGGVFVTITLKSDDPDRPKLQALNRKLIKDFGLVQGVTHTEFIKGKKDDKFYFLETAARVGGAHIAELVEAASGLNPWVEWARLEASTLQSPYTLPKRRREYAGLVLTLARQEHADTSSYNDPEICWRLNKKNHVGLIVKSKKWHRVDELTRHYAQRFQEDFSAVLPPLEKPAH